MKAYTLLSGRPIGRHPTVYFTRPTIDESEPDPWTPKVEEWDSVEDAIGAILDFISPEYAQEHGGIFKEYYESIRFKW